MSASAFRPPHLNTVATLFCETQKS